MGNASPVLREAPISQSAQNLPENLSDVEQVLMQIESQQLDLTSGYADWRNTGFAFADEFGESGRDLFHRVSRFYPEYKSTECDKQFDACIKAKGHGVTIKTIFYLAKQAGIEISNRVGGAGGSSLPLGEMSVGQRGREIPEEHRNHILTCHFLNFLNFL